MCWIGFKQLTGFRVARQGSAWLKLKYVPFIVGESGCHQHIYRCEAEGSGSVQPTAMVIK